MAMCLCGEDLQGCVITGLRRCEMECILSLARFATTSPFGRLAEGGCALRDRFSVTLTLIQEEIDTSARENEGRAHVPEGHGAPGAWVDTLAWIATRYRSNLQSAK